LPLGERLKKRNEGKQESGILFLVNSFGEGKRQRESYKGGFFNKNKKAQSYHLSREYKIKKMNLPYLDNSFQHFAKT
jgi:hypothetical protein